MDNHPTVSLSRRQWITTQELIQDSLSLVPELAGYDSVVGVARSGLAPAATIAQMLHLPLYILRQSTGDIVHAGHGFRLKGRSTALGKTVLIDDTVCSGDSMQKSLSIVGKYCEKVSTCAVYQHPKAAVKADHFAQYLNNPHVLEWNVGNSTYSGRIVWDMDGLICEDCPAECDDDGPRYLDWIRSVKPKCLPRRSRVMIATGRREKWRYETVRWLERYGVNVDLKMHADGSRTFDSIVQHKAKICRGLMASVPRGLDHSIAMLESDAVQSAAIEKLVGRPVWHC